MPTCFWTFLELPSGHQILTFPHLFITKSFQTIQDKTQASLKQFILHISTFKNTNLNVLETTGHQHFANHFTNCYFQIRVGPTQFVWPSVLNKKRENTMVES